MKNFFRRSNIAQVFNTPHPISHTFPTRAHAYDKVFFPCPEIKTVKCCSINTEKNIFLQKKTTHKHSGKSHVHKVTRMYFICKVFMSVYENVGSYAFKYFIPKEFMANWSSLLLLTKNLSFLLDFVSSPYSCLSTFKTVEAECAMSKRSGGGWGLDKTKTCGKEWAHNQK